MGKHLKRFLSILHSSTTGLEIVLGAHNKDVAEDTWIKAQAGRNHGVASLILRPRTKSIVLLHSVILTQVEQIFVHPNWDYGTINNDILLFKLEDEVAFSDAISPVCLPPNGEEVSPGIMVQTTGWGNLECENNLLLL